MKGKGVDRLDNDGWKGIEILEHLAKDPDIIDRWAIQALADRYKLSTPLDELIEFLAEQARINVEIDRGLVAELEEQAQELQGRIGDVTERRDTWIALCIELGSL